MNTIYLISGVVVLIAIFSDFFYTTVSFNGAGILSRNISWGIASFFLWIHKKTKKRGILRFSGVFQILALVVCWIGLLWIGFFLLLMGDSGSIIDPASGQPANALSKLYVSGYTLSTLGIGDYVAESEIWEIILAAFSFVGFIFITTAMTYLISLTNAVIHKRNLSLFIANLGDSPKEIIVHLYDQDEGRFKNLLDYSIRLQEMINLHNQNHYAHPAVHYFYSITREESLSINLVNLDETLTILIHYAESKTLRTQDIRPLRDSITKFLKAAARHYNQVPEKNLPHFPDIEYLKPNNIPLKQHQIMSSAQHEIEERRNSLQGLLHSNGWNWNDIYQDQSN
ncbi:potassium channel family protein [Gracilimonas tropica]|uniref:potassium channel family protein n=1 Tax=Gracilimonas tropica TaxID=454600 RepID=UPI0003A85FD6|nr:potassium channel family protein [Gracilimonas tropica]